MKSKLKRTLTSLLPVAYDRVGSCNSCGACCELPNVCPFLRYKDNGDSHCSIYTVRPPTCRKYPRTSVEFITQGKCGYSFASIENETLSPSGAQIINIVELET